MQTFIDHNGALFEPSGLVVTLRGRYAVPVSSIHQAAARVLVYREKENLTHARYDSIAAGRIFEGRSKIARIHFDLTIEPLSARGEELLKIAVATGSLTANLAARNHPPGSEVDHLRIDVCGNCIRELILIAVAREAGLAAQACRDPERRKHLYAQRVLEEIGRKIEAAIEFEKRTPGSIN